MDYKALAELLFPDVKETIEDIKKKYPDRPEGQLVTRFAPSPTGFLHLGSLFAGLVPRLFARQNNGVFILRLEDTDQQRKVEGAITFMSKGLRDFGIEPDEGRITEIDDRGDYGPYLQSERLGFYHVFIKHLISLGYAYPCWMNSEEIDSVRESQRIGKQVPGIYGNYAQWRDASMDDIKAKLEAGEPYVIRLKSPGQYGEKRIYKDVIRGDVQMQRHFMDTVLIKSDGFPTYHFAHLTDDYLMGTTHVIRAEEWLASVPLHTQLFELFDFVVPAYAHLAQLLKNDDGKKRKLSKRKDPEADVRGLLAGGFAHQGILEYLMTIVSPAYELWQQENPEKHFSEHTIELGGLNKSGALVDIVKMEQINREYLARLSNDDLFDESLVRAEKHDDVFAELLKKKPDYMKDAMSIERHTEKDPKRYLRFQDVYEQIQFFDDDAFAKLEYPDVSEKFSHDDAKEFLTAYADVLNLEQDVMEWFGHLREFGQQFGYAVNNKQFKEGGYKGKTGDLAMLLRVVLCKAIRTPDLFSVMKVMGKERVLERIRIY